MTKLQDNFHQIIRTFVYFVYSAAWILLLPMASIRLLYKSRTDHNYRKRWLERFGFFQYNGQKNGLWCHAVSLGEVIAAVPIIKKIKKDIPDLPIIVTTTTPAGSSQVRRMLGEEVTHVYCPYDASFCVNSFLKKVSPKMLLLIETEVWPNAIRLAYKSGIKIILANARMSKRSARKYFRFAWFTRDIFSRLKVMAISKADAKRLKLLGVSSNSVTITGSVKYDLTLPDDFAQKSRALAPYLQSRDILVIASTHANEEEIILGHAHSILQKSPNLLIFLIPRHPPRASEVKKIAEEKGFSTVLRTNLNELKNDTNIIIGDTIGEMLLFYSYAKVIFIGGSLIKHGGHNPLEAAIFGKPIFSGKHVFNFHEIYNLLYKSNGCEFIGSDNFADKIISVLADENIQTVMGNNAKNTFISLGGALDKQVDIIKNAL